ncbi:MAG: alpha/beta fold hydrolase [Solirubrobacteraceae bacterium]|nr:alpha/beta fold hydrolase [Solirubrobacteraceae bacterium]
MRLVRFPALLLVAMASVLMAPQLASAALPWANCKPAGYQCAKLGVQLDRSGAVPGTLTLDVKRRPAPVPATTAVVALAGGPGQAAVPFAADFAQIFASTLADKDMLVFNQRGTGNSGRISCPAFRRKTGSVRRVVQECSLQLGAKRAFYTTAQSVEDLESIRVAGGYSKLIIYGVSYGTKVALAYAAAHPAAVSSLILDSVVTPEGPDALRRSSLAAIPRAIGDDLCGEDACVSSGGDATGQLQNLAANLSLTRYSGGVYSGSGKRFTARIDAEGLLNVLMAGDLNPALRAELPGAVNAARTGDKQPLLRLSARAAGLENTASLAARKPDGFQAAAADSLAETTLYYATICEEITTFPWTRGAPTSQRITEAGAAVKALPAETFGIFGKSIALSGLPSSCIGWSVAGPPPAAPGALPNVPVLVLDGQADLRTPLEDAQNVAARFPLAQTVAVPDTGHSVVSAEDGTCAKTAVTTFLAGGVAAVCSPAPTVFSPTATPPRKLSQVKAASDMPAKAGRTLNAFAASLLDGRRQVIGEAIGLGKYPKSVGGLRSGSILVKTATKLQFRSYEYVSGVTVSGTLTRRSSTFRIGGRAAARGTITLKADGSASGRLGGKRFSKQPAGSAARAGKTDELPTLAEAVALGRRLVR